MTASDSIKYTSNNNILAQGLQHNNSSMIDVQIDRTYLYCDIKSMYHTRM